MRRLLSLLIVIAAMAACAPKVPPATPGAPHYPDFIFPAPETSAPPGDIAAERLAWNALQAGDLAGAERAFNDVRKRTPNSASATEDCSRASKAMTSSCSRRGPSAPPNNTKC